MILKIMLAQGHTSTGLMTHELISLLAIYLVPKVRLKIHTHAWLNWLQKSSTIKTEPHTGPSKREGDPSHLPEAGIGSDDDRRSDHKNGRTDLQQPRSN